MGIFFKARSSNISLSIGLLFIRISLGSLFLFAGAKKVLNLQEFIETVQETGQMHDTLAFILAFVLPFMEMIFGGLLVIGLFTPVSAFFIACMTVSFIFVLGPGHEELPFSYNFVFFATAVALIFTGAGYISFDALIDRKKEPSNDGIHIKYESKSTVAKEPDETEAIFIEEKDVAKGEDVNG